MDRNILLVEDEEELSLMLADRLQSEGYHVEFARDGDEALRKVSYGEFDLAIVDLMLPLRSGFEVCAGIRRAGISIPIIILTARTQTVDKITGLKLGADDYVCKPFETLELMARIEAQLRRPPQLVGSDKPADSHIHHVGENVVDTQRIVVIRGGDRVYLTSKEYQLLHYLIEHRGETISREDLLSQVWGQKADTMTRTVDMHVSSLRQKLETTPRKPELILTIPGSGYQLVPDFDRNKN